MSVRHRAIAGAPRRSAHEAAAVIDAMVGETLAAAPSIDAAEVTLELERARDAVRMLTAGKHLADHPVVLIAEPLRLEILMVVGSAALKLDEKLGKVPGAAAATDWTLHLPSVAPIEEWVANAVDGLEHVTVDEPPSAMVEAAASSFELSSVDAEALRRAAGADE